MVIEWIEGKSLQKIKERKEGGVSREGEEEGYVVILKLYW